MIGDSLLLTTMEFQKVVKEAERTKAYQRSHAPEYYNFRTKLFPVVEPVVGKDFSFFDFSGSRFVEFEFENCVFRNSHFDHCYFSHCKFRNCDFSYASLMGVVAVRSMLSGCNMVDSRLNDSVWMGGTWARCDFNNSYLADLGAPSLSLVDNNLVLAGQDTRGYQFYAFSDADNIVNIRAGCRYYRGMRDAREHWSEERHRVNPELQKGIWKMLDRIEEAALIKSWRLNP